MLKKHSFFIFSILLFVAILSLELINDRFWLNDFKVYYLAAKAMLSGAPVYGVPFGLGTGFYKYSPFILFTFIPTTLFSFQLAAILHFVFLSFCTVGSMIVIQKIIQLTVFKRKSQNNNFLFFLSLICILNHLVRELHMGNVNILIVLLLSTSLLFTLQAKDVASGIFLALAVLIKPYLVLLLLPLLFHKKTKTLLSFSLAVIASLLLPFLFLGFSCAFQLHRDWLGAMMEHSNYLYSNHTFLYLIRYYLFSGASNSFQLFGLLLIGLMYAASYLYILKPRMKQYNIAAVDNTYLMMAYFVLLALIPNLLITDTEHFLFSLPIIMIVLNHLFETKSWRLSGLFAALIILYGANSSDIYGSDLSNKFEEMGLLGLANIGIVTFVLIISFKKTSTEVLVLEHE